MPYAVESTFNIFFTRLPYQEYNHLFYCRLPRALLLTYLNHLMIKVVFCI